MYQRVLTHPRLRRSSFQSQQRETFLTAHDRDSGARAVFPTIRSRRFPGLITAMSGLVKALNADDLREVGEYKALERLSTVAATDEWSLRVAKELEPVVAAVRKRRS